MVSGLSLPSPIEVPLISCRTSARECELPPCLPDREVQSKISGRSVLARLASAPAGAHASCSTPRRSAASRNLYRRDTAWLFHLFCLNKHWFNTKDRVHVLLALHDLICRIRLVLSVNDDVALDNASDVDPIHHLGGSISWRSL